MKGRVLAIAPGHIAVKTGNTFGVIETDSPAFLINKGFAKTGLRKQGSGLFFGVLLPKVVKNEADLLKKLREVITPEIGEGEDKVDEPKPKPEIEIEPKAEKKTRRRAMAIEVKRGGREAYSCTGCGKQIPAKEPHFRSGGKPYKRYHTKCMKEDKEKVEVSTTVG